MYKIVTDSCADLNVEFFSTFDDLTVLPLTYSINDGEPRNDQPDTAEKSHAFYEELRGGKMSKTSQIPPETFVEAFRPMLAAGDEVLYAAFSSGLSGTCNAAFIAKGMLEEENLPGRLVVVDTLAASAGQGLLVHYLLANRAAGMSMDDNAQWLTDNCLKLAHWFTVDDLNFLKRGGRCSPAAAFFGGMMNIKPVLHVNNEGKLIAREKVRGRKSALKALCDHMKETAIAPEGQTVFISHGDCESDARHLADLLVSEMGVKSENIVLSPIGPVIGSHSGPGTVALFFIANDRG